MSTAADSRSASVDSMLADAISKMDALTKRMDALEVGEKKIIKGDDDDDKKSKQDSKATSSKSDDDDDDDARRKDDDAIRAPKTKILDDEKGAKADQTGQPPPPVRAADKKKRRDDDGELEIKHKKEEKDDAVPPQFKKKAKADDDDDDDDKKDDAVPPQFRKAKSDDDDDDDDRKKDDAIKSDAVAGLQRQIADQQSVIDRLQALIKPKTDDEHAAFADAQARADSVFSGFGQRAPRPLEGESLFDYRKRLATKLKTYSPIWKNVKFSQLPDEAFRIAEDQVYNDATTAAANPMDLEAGELRAVTKTDPTTGVRTIVFYGKESFVKQMGRPGRRVASFRTLASQ
jgi:hypothetical protein